METHKETSREKMERMAPVLVFPKNSPPYSGLVSHEFHPFPPFESNLGLYFIYKYTLVISFAAHSHASVYSMKEQQL
jgi:hypothetical protein